MARCLYKCVLFCLKVVPLHLPALHTHLAQIAHHTRHQTSAVAGSTHHHHRIHLFHKIGPVLLPAQIYIINPNPTRYYQSRLLYQLQFINHIHGSRQAPNPVHLPVVLQIQFTYPSFVNPSLPVVLQIQFTYRSFVNPSLPVVLQIQFTYPWFVNSIVYPSFVNTISTRGSSNPVHLPVVLQSISTCGSSNPVHLPVVRQSISTCGSSNPVHLPVLRQFHCLPDLYP